MSRKKYTMDDYFARMDEIRERHRPKPVAAPMDIITRLRQAAQRRLQMPKLPKV